MDNNIVIPFELLNAVGISRESYENLPVEFRERLETGRLTPLIQLRLTDWQNREINFPAKLLLTPEGNVVFYGVKKQLADEYSLGEKNMNRLQAGEVVKSGVSLYQLDPETRQTVRYNGLEIEDRLKEFEAVNDIHLGERQRQAVRDGKPVELDVGGEKVVVGLDPNEQQGFKLFQGDMKEYEKLQARKYDDLHPEFIGLVQTEQNRWEYQQVVNSGGRVDRAIEQDREVAARMRR